QPAQQIHEGTCEIERVEWLAAEFRSLVAQEVAEQALRLDTDMHHVTGKLARVGDAVVVLLRRRMGGRRGGGFRTAVGLPASLVRLLRLSPVVHLCPSSRARLILCAGCGPQARATIAISWACAPLGSKTPTRYMVISRGR